MKKHQYKIGDLIKLVPGLYGLYDGTECRTGVIQAFTNDDDVPTYDIVFDNGDREEHLYADEFEVIK